MKNKKDLVAGEAEAHGMTMVSADWVPVYELLKDCVGIGQREAIFCVRALLSAIDAVLNRQFSLFDAHTMTNCCHGVAAYSRELFVRCADFDLEMLREQGHLQLSRIGQIEALDPLDSNYDWQVPSVLIELTRLYILCVGSEKHPQFVRRTAPANLRQIHDLTSARLNKIVSRLQKHVSNRVADWYREAINIDGEEVYTAGVSSRAWAEYVKPSFLREDYRGRKYVSTLHSMQVVIGHLVRSEATVILLSDVVMQGDHNPQRVIKILKGSGSAGFALASPDSLGELELDSDEPVVVFCGSSSPTQGTLDSFSQHLDKWSCRLDSLLLAHDLTCPHFPTVRGDKNFDNTPISSIGCATEQVCASHAAVPGVSPNDPSLFCLTHVYSASGGEVLNELRGKGNGLPAYPIGQAWRNDVGLKEGVG